MAVNRNIKYLDRDFESFREELINYSKTYFPSTYTDFSPTSTGMMFMEMAAYVGDVMSFYLDNQIQETFIENARQTENLYNLAYLLGYKPKVTSTSTVELELFQKVPAVTIMGEQQPDYRYAVSIEENTEAYSTSTDNNFIIGDRVDFSFSSSLDRTEVSVYEVAGSPGIPQSYLLKKKVKAKSGNILSTSILFGDPIQFATIDLTSPNIIGVLDIIDSDGNNWYEVPHLAQETIYKKIKNTNTNDPNFYTDYDAPYLLRLEKVQRRFATKPTSIDTLQIQFGSGTPNDYDEEIIPNPDNVGVGLPYTKDKLTTAYSPTNFLFTDTYGISPSNTTLTIRYLTGGGISSNVPANDITSLDTSKVKFLNTSLPSVSEAQSVFSSIIINNPKAASGGGDGDNINEIKQNALGNFQTQLRAVTQDDYLVRSLSMTPDLGTLAKAYASPEKLEELRLGEIPSVVNLFVLGYDPNKRLTTTSKALKQNLKTYLSEYRIINDSIKIKDAYIINIGIDFKIITLPNYMNDEVIKKCIIELMKTFNIDKWQINQPIMLKDLYILLDRVEGVQTVQDIKIYNKTGSPLGYSDYAYDVQGALMNNVIYPSIDPMIFEIKYPTRDIQGRVVPL